jgi:carbon monoxide dehydrogenase subunit G
MTVRVTREFDVGVDRETAWGILSDPAQRAESISVVAHYDVHDDEGTEATWHLQLPLPVVDRTVAVETRDLERRAPEYVKFEGRSKLLNVMGEHELTAIDGGTHVENRFTVESSLPGVESFFERNLDDELENIRTSFEGQSEDPE